MPIITNRPKWNPRPPSCNYQTQSDWLTDSNTTKLIQNQNIYAYGSRYLISFYIICMRKPNGPDGAELFGLYLHSFLFPIDGARLRNTNATESSLNDVREKGHILGFIGCNTDFLIGFLSFLTLTSFGVLNILRNYLKLEY